MNISSFLLMAVVGWTGIDACEHYGDPRCLEIKPIEGRHFINQWIVEIHGGEDTAKMVARETGFEFMEAASDRDNHYFFTHTEIPRRHKMEHEESLTTLKSHDKVVRAGQQYVWRPTLNQLEDYKDFVGLERPMNVVVSTFDPQERIAYYQQLMNRSLQPVYEDDVKVEDESEDRGVNDNAQVPKLEPLNHILDLQGMYALKERMNAEMNQNQMG